MSNWTHIIGSLYVETFKERKNIKKYVENVLNEAPKITGSESDTDIFVNPLSGYNISSWKEDKNGNFLHFQSCVCISLAGDLRDRNIDQTEKEFNEFIDFIKSKFQIYYSSTSIYEDYSGEIRQYRKDWK